MQIKCLLMVWVSKLKVVQKAPFLLTTSRLGFISDQGVKLLQTASFDANPGYCQI